jgi:hypothetical protein
MQETFNYLWSQAGVSFVTKLNRMLVHEDEHMGCLEHTEDIIEDESEKQLLICPGKKLK